MGPLIPEMHYVTISAVIVEQRSGSPLPLGCVLVPEKITSLVIGSESES
jgi:hypothetical protein